MKKQAKKHRAVRRKPTQARLTERRWSGPLRIYPGPSFFVPYVSGFADTVWDNPEEIADGIDGVFFLWDP